MILLGMLFIATAGLIYIRALWIVVWFFALCFLLTFDAYNKGAHHHARTIQTSKPIHTNTNDGRKIEIRS